jgi:exodeoxyribonuclease VII large subunit
VAAALDLAGERAECDVLILARGGGSLEDLWAFNDERVARAIARCAVPVIAGIGHETDVTIADFVADVRAPTPTAAAQLAVPDRRVWLQRLALLAQRFVSAMHRKLTDDASLLRSRHERMLRAHPGSRLAQHAQRLDELELRLRRALDTQMHKAMTPLAPLRVRLESAWARMAAAAANRLDLAARALNAISPLATMERGFSIIVRADGGALVRRVADAPPGSAIEAHLSDGVLVAEVTAHRSIGKRERGDGQS